MALSKAWSPWGKGNLNWGGTPGSSRSSRSKAEFPEDTCFDYLLEGRTTQDERTNRKLKQQVNLYGEIGERREEAWRLNKSNRYAAHVKARKVANAFEKILMKVEEARALYAKFAGQPGMDPIEVPGHLAYPLPN